MDRGRGGRVQGEVPVEACERRRQEKELLADEIPGTEGRYIYRIAAQGKMDASDVVQHFYLVAATTGEQVVVTFTMTPRLVEKLGARDLNLIGGLLVPAMAP